MVDGRGDNRDRWATTVATTFQIWSVMGGDGGGPVERWLMEVGVVTVEERVGGGDGGSCPGQGLAVVYLCCPSGGGCEGAWGGWWQR